MFSGYCKDWETFQDHPIFTRSIIEAFPLANQSFCTRAEDGETIELLLEFGEGMFDPSRILWLHMSRQIWWNRRPETHSRYCEASSILKRLLELGADPHGMKFPVTPLQIAAAAFRYSDTILLLQAGVNPNDCGNKDAEPLEADAPFSWVIGLQGYSPLYIGNHCHGEVQGIVPLGAHTGHCDCDTPSTSPQIRAALIQYSAIEIRPCSSQGTSDETHSRLPTEGE